MTAEDLLKRIQGISLLCLHQEHEVRVKDQIRHKGHTGQKDQQTKALGDTSCRRFQHTGNRQHHGIHHKLDMDRGAVQMHKIQHRQLGPGREQQRRHSSGDTHGKQEIGQHLVRMPGMDGDQEDVDAAKMQRQISGFKITADQKHYMLEQFIGYDQQRRYFLPPVLTGRRKLAIKNTVCGNDYRGRRKPAQVDRSEMLKTKTIPNGITCFQKVGHNASSPQITSAPWDQTSQSASFSCFFSFLI